jgi:hypothetical protein
MRTLLSVWPDGLAPLPESLTAIDAASCTNTSSGLDVHVLNGVASIERGVANAAPHKSAHRRGDCKIFFTGKGNSVHAANRIQTTCTTIRIEPSVTRSSVFLLTLSKRSAVCTT